MLGTPNYMQISHVLVSFVLVINISHVFYLSACTDRRMLHIHMGLVLVQVDPIMFMSGAESCLPVSGHTPEISDLI